MKTNSAFHFSQACGPADSSGNRAGAIPVSLNGSDILAEGSDV